MNAEEDSDESSAPESASENEAVQSHILQEGDEVVEVREDVTPWDDDAGTEDMDTRASAGHRLGARSHGNHVRMKAHNQHSSAMAHDPEDTLAARNDSPQITEEFMDATDAIVDHQRAEDRSSSSSGGKHGEKEGTQESGAVKRRKTTAYRNRMRENKRARVELNTATVGRYETQHGLQIIVGDDPPTPISIVGAVPWEHRGLLGQTSGRMAAGDNHNT